MVSENEAEMSYCCLKGGRWKRTHTYTQARAIFTKGFNVTRLQRPSAHNKARLSARPLPKAQSGPAPSDGENPTERTAKVFTRESGCWCTLEAASQVALRVWGILDGSQVGWWSFKDAAVKEKKKGDLPHMIKVYFFDCEFPFSPYSFNTAVGLQMSSGSTVTTIRSDCPSSVTKFGQRIHTYTHRHTHTSVSFIFSLCFSRLDNRHSF